MSPKANTAVKAANAGEVSLPSFRDGIVFTVRPLNFGGVKAMISAEKMGAGDMVSVMLTQTLKREFPNVTDAEIDNLEQVDFVKLLGLVTEANQGLQDMDFTAPTTKVS